MAGIRGTYKKHKEGFKIAIEYKLNTKLKGHIYGPFFPIYPLYIEVRAKGKNTNFPSFFDFYVSPADFEAFKKNKFIQSLLEKEHELITKCLIDKYSENGDSSDKSWAEVYRQNLLQETIKEKLFYRLRESLSPILLQSETGKDVIYFGLDKKDFAVTLDYIVSSRANWSLEPVIQEGADIIRSFFRVREFLRLYSKTWFSPEMRVDCQSILFLPASEIFSDNQFIKTRSRSFKNADILYTDLTEIQEYIG